MEPKNVDYQNICEAINLKTKSFREYYAEFDYNPEVDNLDFPDFRKYWSISLD